jgi:hypothetical protein
LRVNLLERLKAKSKESSRASPYYKIRWRKVHTMNEQVESLQTAQPEASEAQTLQPQLKDDEDELLTFTVSSKESQKVRCENRKKLIDYTVSRNPKYEMDSCIEQLQQTFDSFQVVMGTPENVLLSESEIRPKSPSRRLSMPSFRSIDTGSFTFQERTGSSEEERIEFMFKVKPAEKRSGRSRRLEALKRERRPPRKRLQPRMFASSTDGQSDPFVAKRTNSAPNDV